MPDQGIPEFRNLWKIYGKFWQFYGFLPIAGLGILTHVVAL